MNQTQFKYLQRCVRSRILGNQVEFHYKDNIKMFRAINLILNDIRFITVLDERIDWIEYASNHIKRFIESINNWGNETDWMEKIEKFLVSWFITHFDKNITFPHNQDGAYSDKEDCDDDFSDMHLNMSKAFDMTDFDISSKNSLCNVYMSDKLAALIKTSNNGFEESEAEIEYLNSIDKSIVDLALKLGRSGGVDVLYSDKSRFESSYRNDIIGIITGNNLNAMLPSETALLGDVATENVFYRKFVEKQLQVFASASSSFKKDVENNGPIIVCIDKSFSMYGDKAGVAKKLALAIAIVAQRTRRTLCIINYSNRLSYFVLTNFRRQKNSFIKFLSHSHRGGNDENLLFSFIFRSLLNNPKYAHIRRKISGADMLIISDFEWGVISTENCKNLANAHKNGMRFFSLDVDGLCYTYGAEKYLEQCAYRYNYVDGKCINIK